MDYPSPRELKTTYIEDPEARCRSIETRISHFEDFKACLKEQSYGETNPNSFLLTVSDDSNNTITDRHNYRRADTFKSLVDRLSVKKEKQGTLLKFYQSLEHQVNENYRISVIELNSKRNELIGAIDEIIEDKIESLRKSQFLLMNSLRNHCGQVNTKQEEVQGLIETLKSKIVEENAEMFSEIFQKARRVLDEELLTPQASYESVKIEPTSFNYKIVSDDSNDVACQTKQIRNTRHEPRSHRYHSQIDFSFESFKENRGKITIRQVNAEDARVPFLGINRIKVCLPEHFDSFVVASFSLRSTVHELLLELTEHLNLNFSCYRLQITTKGIKEAAYLNPSQRLSTVASPSAILLLTKN